MKIKDLYRNYFQKSRIFLYPIIGIQRGAPIVPKEVYVSWEGNYKPEDRRLICVYPVKNAEQFDIFVKSTLSKNPLFEKDLNIDNKHHACIFNFDNYASDWNKFLSGKYSEFSDEFKSKISTFFSKSPTNLLYIKSFLYPESFHNEYADLLKVKSSLIREVKELCDKPDFSKETYKTESYVSTI
jgi:hypothetical protein